MLFTSEKTMKSYKTVEELEAAEKKFDEEHAAEAKLKEEKQAALAAIKAKEAELAKLYDEVATKRQEIEKAQFEFAKKYNGYHSTRIVKDGQVFDGTVSENAISNFLSLIDDFISTRW